MRAVRRAQDRAEENGALSVVLAGKQALVSATETEGRIAACVELIGHTGTREFQIRYSDDVQPVIWMAAGRWQAGWEVAAAFDPLGAVFRLLEHVVDGGECKHCHRTTGVTLHFDAMPLPREVCWYQYDPELQKFRRGCEGD